MTVSLPVIEQLDETPEEIAALQAEIRALARQRNAVVIAHNYQRPEVQDVADFVGDSLGLSRQAAKTPAEVIVFAGVHFMAETAAILSPAEAGAAARPPRRLLARGHDQPPRTFARWKAEFPAHRGGLRQHDSRGEGGARLLLHQRQRARRHRRHPGRQGHPVPAGLLPRRPRPADAARPAGRGVDGECHVHKGIRSTTSNAARERLPGRGGPGASGVRLRGPSVMEAAE